MVKYVACITSYTDGISDLPVRMSLVVTDISKDHSPIMFSRDWWERDYIFDDILTEIDELIGDLNEKYYNLCKIHVRGMVKLTLRNGFYLSNIITQKDFISLVNDDPSIFE